MFPHVFHIKGIIQCVIFSFWHFSLLVLLQNYPCVIYIIGCSFLLLSIFHYMNNTTLYLLKDVWVDSNFRLLMKQLSTQVFVLTLFLFTLSTYSGIELLGHMVCVYSTLGENDTFSQRDCTSHFIV